MDQLAYRSKSFAVVATVFTLALVLSQYFITYRQKIMKDGEVDRKGWLQTTLICLALSFLFASTAGFFLGAAYAKKDGINALKIDMTLSYGQVRFLGPFRRGSELGANHRRRSGFILHRRPTVSLPASPA